MSDSSKMVFLGAIEGMRCFWADPSKFDAPGFYYEDKNGQLHQKHLPKEFGFAAAKTDARLRRESRTAA